MNQDNVNGIIGLTGVFRMRDDDKKSFLATLPGILTGLAALIDFTQSVNRQMGIGFACTCVYIVCWDVYRN